jgi:predicted DNA-binding transcriptional regulator AlpA
MNIDKNTRLIDLTVADLMVIVKEGVTGFMPVDETLNDEDEIGGYEIAEKITGYSRQTLYQLKSAGELPYIGLAGGGIRFSKKMLMNWLLSHQKLTHQAIQEKVETLKLKRKLRRK